MAKLHDIRFVSVMCRKRTRVDRGDLNCRSWEARELKAPPKSTKERGLSEVPEQIRQQFNKLSAKFDGNGLWARYFRYSASRVVEVIRTECQNLEHIRMLDIGCGTGTLLVHLASHHPEGYFLGVDISENMIDQAKRKAASAGLRNVSFEILDVDNQPLTSGPFDVINCSNCFHHFVNAHRALFSISKSLSENGTFIFVDPIREGPLRMIWTRLLKSTLFDEPYASYYKRSEIADICREKGLKLKYTESLLYFVWLGVFKGVN
jgi:ubiquinone/menaquinone biosynthesis C-methylase UbiE